LKHRYLGREAKLTIYNDMEHGFLGFDAPGGMKYASKCVLDCCEFIRELLNPPELEIKNIKAIS